MKYLLPLAMMLIPVMCVAQPQLQLLKRGPAGYEFPELPRMHVEPGMSFGAAIVEVAHQGIWDKDPVQSGQRLPAPLHHGRSQS